MEIKDEKKGERQEIHTTGAHKSSVLVLEPDLKLEAGAYRHTCSASSQETDS